MISERGDYKVMVSIDLARWSKIHSCLSLESGIECKCTLWGTEGKLSTRRVKSQDKKDRIFLGVRFAYKNELICQAPPFGKKEENGSKPGHLS